MKHIELIYNRLPNRVSHFQQELIYEDETAIVTRQKIKPSSPLIIDGVTALDDDYTALWFIFPGKWYDIGKMYNPQGECTGYYCDIIMPMKRTNSKDKRFAFTVEITDLCLDLWICSLREAVHAKTKSCKKQRIPVKLAQATSSYRVAFCGVTARSLTPSAYSLDGCYHILDEDEFEIAVKNGWMDNMLARKARQELNNLIQLVKTNEFPPAIAETITI